MTKSIKSIFEINISLIGTIDTAIIFFRKQQYDRALEEVADSIELIKTAIDAIISDRDYFNLVSANPVLDMLSGILEAQRNKDFILLADLLELQLLSFLISAQELIISKEEILFDEENYIENIKVLKDKNNILSELTIDTINPDDLLIRGYRVEFTSSGLMTLAAENEGKKFYFHTNGRIVSEALLLADSWIQADVKKYILFGYGMGYHIRELHKLLPEVMIEVYEADLNVLQLAAAFTDMKSILDNDQITLIYDPEYTLLQERLKELKEKEHMLLHYPSYKNIREQNARKLLGGFIPWFETLEDLS